MISVMRQAQAGQGWVFDEIEAVRGWLAARPDCTGQIGVIGFCMGGGLALMLAPRPGYAASSVNYGSASRKAYSAGALAGACPVVGSFGGQDRLLRGAAERLRQALDRNGVACDIKEYPAAGHGFLNDHERDGGKPPLMFAVFARLMPGIGFHEESAQDARQRILAFFRTHLNAVSPAP
jgi:carboxymethylenebutenolidase